MEQFASCWEGLEDPRTGNAGLHDFHELLMIALCTTLCGGQSAMAMARFAEAKESFLRGLSAERFNEVARAHWGVENALHWRLDVV